MNRKIVTLLLLVLVAFSATACGFANNMTGQLVRGAPQMVLRGGY